ncbi:MAG TPA: hypothetical protein VGJ21_11295 [Terracidiphilus sp.]
MRRSRQVHLTLLASVAFALTGCKPERRDCVDAQSRKLPDEACQAHPGSTGYIPGAHFWYGGSSGGHVGDTVIGGGVSRGGFGSIGGSHGGE